METDVNLVIKSMGVAAVLAATAGGAWAAATAADAIHARQAGFKQMSAAFKGLNDQLNSPAPDKAQVAALSKRVNEIAPQIGGWFPAGTGPEAGVKTRAKPDIWAKPAEFQAAARALPVETAKLASLGAMGDIEAAKAQFKVVGGKCGACHTPFREKE
jgi:cytochrome c556